MKARPAAPWRFGGQLSAGTRALLAGTKKKAGFASLTVDTVDGDQTPVSDKGDPARKVRGRVHTPHINKDALDLLNDDDDDDD